MRLGLPEFLAERYVGAVYFGYGFDVAWEWWVVVPLGSVGALLILPSLGPFRSDAYFVGGCALVGAALPLIGWYLVRLPATRRRRLAARQWLREIDAQYNLNSSK